jgi:hypothetical protein
MALLCRSAAATAGRWWAGRHSATGLLSSAGFGLISDHIGHPIAYTLTATLVAAAVR